MGRAFDVVVTEDEDGFRRPRASAAGCLTQARTRDEALRNIREAIQLFLETGESPDPHVKSVALETVNVEA